MCVHDSDLRDSRYLCKGIPEIFNGTSDKNYLFSSVLFDIDPEGNFYVGFMADPYIYKFDKDFIPITSFGEQGREMDTHYLSITSIPEIRSKGLPQWQTKGYYNWIEYLEEPGYLLRSYKRARLPPQTDCRFTKTAV